MIEWIVFSTVAVSLISLIGVFFLGMNGKLLKRITLLLVAFAVGGMMGGALFHMLPEALDESDAISVFTLMLAGFMFFFIIEKFLHWRHCHDEDCEVHGVHKKDGEIHPVAYLNLIGDAVHNFTDGAVIATSFMVDVQVGIASTIAIALHEIPQEMGDFGILIHSGMDVKRALLYNLLSGLTAVMGAVFTYIFLINIEHLAPLLLPAAAGGFVYIAATDLTPELHKERRVGTSIMQFGAILVGVGLMYYIKVALGG